MTSFFKKICRILCAIILIYVVAQIISLVQYCTDATTEINDFYVLGQICCIATWVILAHWNFEMASQIKTSFRLKQKTFFTKFPSMRIPSIIAAIGCTLTFVFSLSQAIMIGFVEDLSYIFSTIAELCTWLALAAFFFSYAFRSHH